MNAEEFVDKLAKLAPSVDDLIVKGYEREVAEEIRSAYFNEKNEVYNDYDDPLLDLINNYDTSNLEIGILKIGNRKYDFPSPPEKIRVGSVESDILVINPKTGHVELLDHAHPEYVIGICAVSGERFLEAILLLADFEMPYLDSRLKNKITEKQSVANNLAAHKKAAECTKVAGLGKEATIFHLLLGCDCWIS